MNALEEIIIGLLHHRHIVDSVLGLAGGTLYQLITASFLVLLMLIPFFAFRVLGELVGESNLICLLFLQRHSISDS